MSTHGPQTTALTMPETCAYINARKILERCLSPYSQAAIDAIIEAIPESDWTRKFHDLAAQVAGLGSSHRGSVEVIRLLSCHGTRAKILASHAVARLLPNLLVAKVGPLP